MNFIAFIYKANQYITLAQTVRLGFMMLFIGLSGSAHAASIHLLDQRFIIGISQSLTIHDTHELRQHIVLHWLDQLPLKSTAGIWTYGKYVNMLVPLREVTPLWQRRAKRRIHDLSAVAKYANLAEALDIATYDWHTASMSDRQLFIMTDARISVADDPLANQKARQYILDTILPRLEHAQVQVNTIALGTQADNALLTTLAERTGGWFEQIETIEDMARATYLMQGLTPPLEHKQIAHHLSQSALLQESLDVVLKLTDSHNNVQVFTLDQAEAIISQTIVMEATQNYILQYQVSGETLAGDRVEMLSNPLHLDNSAALGAFKQQVADAAINAYLAEQEAMGEPVMESIDINGIEQIDDEIKPLLEALLPIHDLTNVSEVIHDYQLAHADVDMATHQDLEEMSIFNQSMADFKTIEPAASINEPVLPNTDLEQPRMTDATQMLVLSTLSQSLLPKLSMMQWLMLSIGLLLFNGVLVGLLIWIYQKWCSAINPESLFLVNELT